jgi:DNA ligase-associated metallophosphoesterase
MRVVERSAHSIDVAGERVELLPQRAVWWPAARTLLVADLHIGKEATFRRFGIAMPHGVLEESLERLSLLVAMTGAERIVVIGDLIHAKQGMSAEVVERFASWRASFDGAVELVIGNHDRHVQAMPASWRVTVREESTCDGPFAYRHEPHEDAEQPDGNAPAATAAAFRWCGHLHPTVRVVGAALPAFVIGRRQAILPAFTAFSRGPGMSPRDDESVYAIASGAVVRL